MMRPACLGGVPERPKGSDCKSDGSAFEGSNPSPSTILLYTALSGVDNAKAAYNLVILATPCVERFPSGQRDQTVNLTAQPSKVRILLSPPFFLLFYILFVSLFSSSLFHIASSIFKSSIALCVSVSHPDRFCYHVIPIERPTCSSLIFSEFSLSNSPLSC